MTEQYADIIHDERIAQDDTPLGATASIAEEMGLSEEDLWQIVQEKIGKVTRVFKGPVLETQFQHLLASEDELLSLDREIAIMKIRFETVAKRKGSRDAEIAAMLRSLTDAVDYAYSVREKRRQYVHLEQLMWVLQHVYEIAEDEVTSQHELREFARRLSLLQLPKRENIPVAVKAMAHALAEGRRLDEGKN